jgi:hypothetical protein
VKKELVAKESLGPDNNGGGATVVADEPCWDLATVDEELVAEVLAAVMQEQLAEELT